MSYQELGTKIQTQKSIKNVVLSFYQYLQYPSSSQMTQVSSSISSFSSRWIQRLLDECRTKDGWNQANTKQGTVNTFVFFSLPQFSPYKHNVAEKMSQKISRHDLCKKYTQVLFIKKSRFKIPPKMLVSTVMSIQRLHFLDFMNFIFQNYVLALQNI